MELPSFCYRDQNLKIDGAVIHYLSGRYVDYENRFDPQVCRQLIIDLNSAKGDRVKYLKNDREKRYFASYHCFITRKGEIHRWVPYDKQAYHAGSSEINGRKDLNRWALGIALSADPHSGFTEEQYKQAANELHRVRLKTNQVWGHDKVATPPGRKVDPGENFDWDKLYRNLRSRYSGMV